MNWMAAAKHRLKKNNTFRGPSSNSVRQTSMARKEYCLSSQNNRNNLRAPARINHNQSIQANTKISSDVIFLKRYSAKKKVSHDFSHVSSLQTLPESQEKKINPLDDLELTPNSCNGTVDRLSTSYGAVVDEAMDSQSTYPQQSVDYYNDNVQCHETGKPFNSREQLYAPLDSDDVTFKFSPCESIHINEACSPTSLFKDTLNWASNETVLDKNSQQDCLHNSRGSNELSPQVTNLQNKTCSVGKSSGAVSLGSQHSCLVHCDNKKEPESVLDEKQMINGTYINLQEWDLFNDFEDVLDNGFQLNTCPVVRSRTLSGKRRRLSYFSNFQVDTAAISGEFPGRLMTNKSTVVKVEACILHVDDSVGDNDPELDLSIFLQ